MKRRKLADPPEGQLETIVIEDDEDFLPSPLAKRFQFRGVEAGVEKIAPFSSLQEFSFPIAPVRYE
jgi:hypothetical protein